jgi:L,D-transpeptidase ErfK/SrfK
MASGSKRMLVFKEIASFFIQRRALFYFSFIFVLLGNSTWGAIYVLPAQGNRIGEVEYAVAEVGETLNEVGLRFDIGFNEMVKANPNLDKTHPFFSSVRVRIPAQFILPNAPHNGIVIDLHQYRLFFFPSNENVVYTYPVGIGRKGWNTPIGKSRIIAKERNPVWRPSRKLRKEAERNGMMLPETFPASPVNPLGSFALRLSWSSYLIHGTNRRDGVGMRVSAGCIRMLPEDIEQLFSVVQVNTPVLIL